VSDSSRTTSSRRSGARAFVLLSASSVRSIDRLRTRAPAAQQEAAYAHLTRCGSRNATGIASLDRDLSGSGRRSGQKPGRRVVAVAAVLLVGCAALLVQGARLRRGLFEAHNKSAAVNRRATDLEQQLRDQRAAAETTAELDRARATSAPAARLGGRRAESLHAGLGRGDALRQAKRAMLKRSGREHPFFWASFFRSGEWASLDGRR
jgi:type VI protein secretion system component VasK